MSCVFDVEIRLFGVRARRTALSCTAGLNAPPLRASYRGVIARSSLCVRSPCSGWDEQPRTSGQTRVQGGGKAGYSRDLNSLRRVYPPIWRPAAGIGVRWPIKCLHWGLVVLVSGFTLLWPKSHRVYLLLAVAFLEIPQLWSEF